MVTTRAAGIRFGLVRGWPVKSAELGFFYNNFDFKVRVFFSNFFSQSILIGMGVALSGVLLRRFANRLLVEVFLQDSRMLDWLSTRPGFRMKKLRRTRLKKRLAISRKTFFRYRGFDFSQFSLLKNYRPSNSFRKSELRRKVRQYSKLRYFRRRRKYFLLRRARKHNRYSKLCAVIFRLRRKHGKYLRLRLKKRVLRPKYSYRSKKLQFSRRRPRKAPRLFGRPNFRVATRFFRNFSRFCRFRFFRFFARIASLLAYKKLGLPIFFRLNFIGRIGSAQFYLNYITTKLYYRYILNDVINPIVRISLKYYRGFRIICRGRFTRAQIATERIYRRGALQLSAIHVPVDYAQKSVVLKYGTCNLKIWLRY